MGRCWFQVKERCWPLVGVTVSGRVVPEAVRFDGGVDPLVDELTEFVVVGGLGWHLGGVRGGCFLRGWVGRGCS